jgi:hypothetical protein
LTIDNFQLLIFDFVESAVLVLATNIAISSPHSAMAAEITDSSTNRFREMIFSQITVSRSSLSDIFILCMNLKRKMDMAFRAPARGGV